MSSVWPWLAVAGAGALHGLNPTTGWAFAAAWGVGSRDRAKALRALLPIAAGHTASIVVVATTVAAAVSLGKAVDLVVLQVIGATLLAAGGLHCLAGGGARRWRPAVGHAGLALWSFIMSTLQGAGLMLVPALVPLCMGDGAVREITSSGSLSLALAAIGLHMAAMLAVTGAMAAGACRGFDAVAEALGLRRNNAAPGTMGLCPPHFPWPSSTGSAPSAATVQVTRTPPATRA